MNAQDREWLGRIESKLDTNTAETAELKGEIHTLSVKAFGNGTRVGSMDYRIEELETTALRKAEYERDVAERKAIKKAVWGGEERREADKQAKWVKWGVIAALILPFVDTAGVIIAYAATHGGGH